MQKRLTENAPNSVADLVAAGLALQGQGLALLLAEARALATLLPGHWTPHPSQSETEADQDNVPV